VNGPYRTPCVPETRRVSLLERVLVYVTWLREVAVFAVVFLVLHSADDWEGHPDYKSFFSKRVAPYWVSLSDVEKRYQNRRK
jgi:hypothetical protein